MYSISFSTWYNKKQKLKLNYVEHFAHKPLIAFKMYYFIFLYS